MLEFFPTPLGKKFSSYTFSFVLDLKPYLTDSSFSNVKN